MTRGRALRLLPLGFMAAVAAVTYAAIVYTLRRGFDWTDETFVYTLIASNRETVGEPWGFQHLLHPLYVLTGESVLAFRVVRLAGYVLLSVALVWTARFVTRQMGMAIARSGWVFVLLLAQTGTFLAFSYPPRSIGYNELASWLTQLGVALILLSLAWGLSRRADLPGVRWLWPVWAGLGGIVVLLLFAKATSGLAFGAVLAVALLVPHRSFRLWKRVVSLGAGVAGVLLLLWALQVPTGFYFSNTWALITEPAARDAFGHPVSGMLANVVASLRTTGRNLVPALLIFALFAAAFRGQGTPARVGVDRVLLAARWLLGAALILALVRLPRPHLWGYLGEVLVFLGAAALIGLVVLGASRGVPRGSGPRGSAARGPGWRGSESRGSESRGSVASRWFAVAVGGSAVAAAPFICAVGTSNAITGQLLYSVTIWSVALGVALTLMSRRVEPRPGGGAVVPHLVGCALILLVAVLVRDHLDAPYRSAPLLSQKTSTAVPALRGLLLTETDAAWADWVSASGRTLDAGGVPATSIFSPGALFVFNQSGYANPWVGAYWPAAYESLRLACTKERPTDLFVLEPGLGEIERRHTTKALSTAAVTKSLAGCGISFPGDFRVVDKRDSPNLRRAMTIWRLKSG